VPRDAYLAVGWQGWLRDLTAGRTVARLAPRGFVLLRRAQLVGVSQHDLAFGTHPADLRRLLQPEASLVITDGPRGGQLLRDGSNGEEESWPYGAIAAQVEVDPTGAGDVFLAAFLASTVRPSIVSDGHPDVGRRLAFAAAAASLLIEGPGLMGVPDVAAVRARVGFRRRHLPASGSA
jgi:sugar/nucleoside kinase (ribokinase family)